MSVILDPATTLANAVATLLNADPHLSLYHFVTWESDVDVALPRGYVNVVSLQSLRGVEKPDQFNVEIVFEGKPKTPSPSDAVAEAMGQVRREDFAAVLQALITDGSLTLFSEVIDLRSEHQITGDVRRRTVGFTIFGQWNAVYAPG
jgi:hypothetical protein